MNFSHYYALAQQNNAFTIDKNWTQGRSIFGGLSAALVLSHIEANTDLTNKDLKTINAHFCGPIDAGKPSQIKCTLLSQGKSISQVQGQLIQDGNVKTLIVACFGAQRRSSVNVPSNTLNPLIPPENAVKIPFIKDMTPNFIQHMDVRFTSKNVPFSGSENTTLNGWMRFADTPGAFSDAAMLALIDAWPPAVLGMLKDFAPASTVTWNIEFIQPRPNFKSNDFLYYECNVVQAGSGYAHTEGKIYHPDGQLLALSRQLVAVYDKVAGT